MFGRKTEGSVICTSCGVLVGVNDPTCYNCNRRNPGLWGYAPVLKRLGNDLGFIPFVTGFTIIMYVLSLVMSRDGTSIGFEPNSVATQILGASGAIPVFGRGWWWTVLTAGWLHGGILHIFFNVLWIRQLGPEIANMYGAGRMVIIFTVAGVAGFTLSSVMGLFTIPFFGAGITVGASASIFGFLGALVHYGRRTGSSHAKQAGLQYALFMGIMGFIFPGVDNAAHLGGFAGGYLASLVLDPLKPERIDHIAIAVGCLAVTLAAVVYTVISALPYIR
ncbi:MAG TPA: rhomboid family intramembrane serine protease [Vicinamibacterales bacterium]|nr:rhomboid family intramembrane serine protease [Vicinamibacterales bacterium]